MAFLLIILDIIFERNGGTARTPFQKRFIFFKIKLKVFFIYEKFFEMVSLPFRRSVAVPSFSSLRSLSFPSLTLPKR